jgi:uncharacterized protein YbaR (Trm112 family)
MLPERPFRRYRSEVLRTLDRWPPPGTLLIGVPELAALGALFVCPRCTHTWPLGPEHTPSGPDTAPTVAAAAVCPACGAHYRIEAGRISQLTDVPRLRDNTGTIAN